MVLPGGPERKHRQDPGFGAGRARYPDGMSDAMQGGNRHVWESEYEGLADELRSEPVEALPELLALVERMLAAAGYDAGLPGAAPDRDVDISLERAGDVVRRRERGEVVADDDAYQAAAELRELYKALLGHPEAEAGADLQELDSDPLNR